MHPALLVHHSRNRICHVRKYTLNKQRNQTTQRLIKESYTKVKAIAMIKVIGEVRIVGRYQNKDRNVTMKFNTAILSA